MQYILLQIYEVVRTSIRATPACLFTRRPMSLPLRFATPFTYELNYYTLHPPAATVRAVALVPLEVPIGNCMY